MIFIVKIKINWYNKNIKKRRKVWKIKSLEMSGGGDSSK